MNNNQTFDILKAATAEIRADYVARYTELELRRLVEDRACLANVGMDAEQYAPYPSGNQSRADYMRGKAKYDRVRAYFQSVNGYHRHNGPDIVVEKQGTEPHLRATAKQSADALVDAYLLKMAKKIGKDITAASTNGRIWECATLTVTCADGEVQIWHTQCILNVSCLGKLFNQWPTRRKS